MTILQRCLLSALMLVLPAVAQITEIQGTDVAKDSRTVINNNFTWLNYNKAGLGSCATGTFAVQTTSSGVVCMTITSTVVSGLGTAATKNVGTTASDVAAGNHGHSGVYEPADPNIQTHLFDVSNPHSVTKTQVGLGNVADVDTTNATNISSGTLDAARLPSTSVKGGAALVTVGNMPVVDSAGTLKQGQIADDGADLIVTGRNVKIGNTVHSAENSEPTCNLANRGKVVRVLGGAGVADTYRQCVKTADDSYGWFALAAGTAQNTDTGTTSTTFQIDSGNSGPKLKNNAGVLEVRNAADSAYAQISASQFNAPAGSALTMSGAEQAAPTVSVPTCYIDSTTHLLTCKNGSDAVVGALLPASQNVTETVASGQTAMPTGSLAANTCSASATTATATGTATTDAVLVAYASDPTGATGYGAGTNGGITIRYWPTLNTVNFKLCNETDGSITPGSLSVNWRVVR